MHGIFAGLVGLCLLTENVCASPTKLRARQSTNGADGFAPDALTLPVDFRHPRLDGDNAPLRAICIPNCGPSASIWPMQCNGFVPGVDEMLEKARELDEDDPPRESSPGIFFTGYPITQDEALKWARPYFEERGMRFTFFDNVITPTWVEWIQFWIIVKRPLEIPLERSLQYMDMMLKHKSQALAEQARGDAYLVVKDDFVTDSTSWDPTRTWGGWEWPALTRNPLINTIYRVRPITGSEPRVIWRREDGPQGVEPLGMRETMQQNTDFTFNYPRPEWLSNLASDYEDVPSWADIEGYFSTWTGPGDG